MNARFTQVDASLDGLRSDMNARLAQGDARFASLDEKLDRQVSRLLGMQVAVLLAVVSALAGAYFR